MREDVAELLNWIGLVVRLGIELDFDDPIPIDWRERATPDQVADIRRVTLPVILAFGRVFAG